MELGEEGDFSVVTGALTIKSTERRGLVCDDETVFGFRVVLLGAYRGGCPEGIVNKEHS